jgi:hypothetical protein
MAQISCLHREVALELERVAPSGKVRKSYFVTLKIGQKGSGCEALGKQATLG